MSECYHSVLCHGMSQLLVCYDLLERSHSQIHILFQHHLPVNMTTCYLLTTVRSAIADKAHDALAGVLQLVYNNAAS